MKNLVRALTATVAVLIVLIPAGAASAESTADAEIAKLLEFYRGSHAVGSEGVQISPGVEVLLPRELRAAGPLDGASPCPGQRLCVFEHQDFDGLGLALSACEETDLGLIPHPVGYNWGDQMSSFVNNQAAGTKSTFYNFAGATKMVWFVNAAPGVMGWMNTAGNDHIDRIQVC